MFLTDFQATLLAGAVASALGIVSGRLTERFKRGSEYEKWTRDAFHKAASDFAAHSLKVADLATKRRKSVNDIRVEMIRIDEMLRDLEHARTGIDEEIEQIERGLAAGMDADQTKKRLDDLEQEHQRVTRETARTRTEHESLGQLINEAARDRESFTDLVDRLGLNYQAVSLVAPPKSRGAATVVYRALIEVSDIPIRPLTDEYRVKCLVMLHDEFITPLVETFKSDLRKPSRSSLLTKSRWGTWERRIAQLEQALKDGGESA